MDEIDPAYEPTALDALAVSRLSYAAAADLLLALTPPTSSTSKNAI
jgi:hypothetical protein